MEDIEYFDEEIMSLNKRNDMIRALNRTTPCSGNHVPVWEIEFHLWDKFSGKKLILGREFESLTQKQQQKALFNNAEIFVEVSEMLHFAGISLPGGYWEIAPGEPAYFWLPEKAQLEQVRITKNMTPDSILITSNSGILAMPEANDFVDFSMKLYDDPEEIDSMAMNKNEQGIARARQLVDHGIDALCSSSDIADNRGPYFNPEQMERLIWPYLSKWADKVKKMGAYTILHSDGNLMPCLDGIADSGIHALQSIDPVAGMIMKEVKDRVGDRLCLCGNIDCGLMLTAPGQEVFDATRNLLVECKGNGGMVLGASNALQKEVSKNNYFEMINAWKDYGSY